MLYNNTTINIQKLNSQNQISQNFLFEKGKAEEEKKDILLKDKKNSYRQYKLFKIIFKLQIKYNNKT